MSKLDAGLADVPAPFPLPIGLGLSQAARAVERAFGEALGEAGGTLPVWLILLDLKIRKPASKRELAEAVGVREASLTQTWRRSVPCSAIWPPTPARGKPPALSRPGRPPPGVTDLAATPRDQTAHRPTLP